MTNNKTTFKSNAVAQAGAGVHWEGARVAEREATVFNISTTRRSISLSLGNVSQRDDNGKPQSVDVTNKVLLNPWAAKRLAKLLNNVVDKYEATYGELVPANKK